MGQSNGNASLGARILLLETDEGRGEVFRSLLRSQDCRVRSVSVPNDVEEVFRSRVWDAVFCEMAFAKTLLPLMKGGEQMPPVILLAGYAEMAFARQLVEDGRAFGYQTTPLRSEKALQMLREALVLHPMKADRAEEDSVQPSEEDAPCEKHFGLIYGESAQMQELYQQIRRVALTDMNVLILGESGTGKELVAKAIHASGNRSERPFVAVNCSSLPENLLESELFGYVKGAFTGASHNKDGLFLAADGGTLFLDEVGSISPATQMALLRALQEREIRPVGSTHTIPVNVRVLAATNEDVGKLRESGRFRDDLFFRISAFSLKIPPLRERGDDLKILDDVFLEELSKDGTPLVLSHEAREACRRHKWPGNVRELFHALEHGATMAEDGVIGLRQLPEAVVEDLSCEGSEQFEPDECQKTMTLKAYLRHCERQYLQRVLEEQNGDKERAARLLGISVATLYRKLSER
ncbi:MAG: sigma-54 dependent transcriptional regulator [Lentisphaeria bacterium]|nr:sigma-54 dependent transcriptional regulator [Lentisphaeria bacterium]